MLFISLSAARYLHRVRLVLCRGDISIARREQEERPCARQTIRNLISFDSVFLSFSRAYFVSVFYFCHGVVFLILIVVFCLNFLVVPTGMCVVPYKHESEKELLIDATAAFDIFSFKKLKR